MEGGEWRVQGGGEGEGEGENEGEGEVGRCRVEGGGWRVRQKFSR
jgi:hypothetical protein